MAKLVSLNLDAALLEGLLSTSSRRVTCRELHDPGVLVSRAVADVPDLVVVSGAAGRAAEAAEALVDHSSLLEVPLVAWRVQGSLADTSRLVALGVRLVDGDEQALRTACEEALDARAGRTIRVDPPTEVRVARDRQLDLHGRRMVVADDDPAITWFVADLLRGEGCDVREVEDGEAALDAARRTLPDAVISDIRMPRMDGVRLCRALRSDPILCDVPVVLLSWKHDWLDHAREIGVEASAFLEKRSTPEDIAQCIRDVIADHVRLEERMRPGGDSVRGRLDGTSPYRLLRLACASHRDARLTIRCSLHAYEVQIRDGAPRAAVRVSADGTAVHGGGALASLLAERTGRFALSPEHAPVDAELTGSLHQQLAAHVALARRASSPREDAILRLPEAAPAVAPATTLMAAPSEPVRPAPVPAPVPAPAPAPALVIVRPPIPAVFHAPSPVAAEPFARTLRLQPAARPASRFERTAPLPPPPAARASRPVVAAEPRVGSVRRIAWRASLRWVGVAALAALGVVLGAGVRALRQGPDASQPAQAAASRAP